MSSARILIRKADINGINEKYFLARAYLIKYLLLKMTQKIIDPILCLCSLQEKVDDFFLL